MAGSSRLQTDILFQGLTRPAMIAGVSYMYFVINALLCMLTFVNTQNMLMLLVVGPAIHGVGFFVCRNEPRAIELFMMKSTWGYKSWNNVLGYHNYANSYDVF
jgi:type IV secretion system protein VirB3